MAADWFHKLGFTLPYGTNVADFILDLASGAILTGERCVAAVRAHCEARACHRVLRTQTDQAKVTSFLMVSGGTAGTHALQKPFSWVH